MPLRIIGPPPFTKDERGRCVRIATVFPNQNVLVTVPGIHATQRLHFLDVIDQERAQEGRAPLSSAERATLLFAAVDLILDEHTLQIRPDAERMDLTFQADEVLADHYSTGQVRFLDVRIERVFEALMRRGARWRIFPADVECRDAADDRTLADCHPRPSDLLLRQCRRHTVPDLSRIRPPVGTAGR